MDLQGAVFMEYLAKSIAEGKVDVARIDAAVKAILEMKYRLGLFEDPYRYSNEAREKATVYRPDFLEPARDVASKSMVLPKNDIGRATSRVRVCQIAWVTGGGVSIKKNR